MSTDNPVSPKVIASTVTAGVAGAVTTVGVWIIEEATRIDIPSPVEGAIVVIIAAVGSLVAGYLTRDPARRVAS